MNLTGFFWTLSADAPNVAVCICPIFLFLKFHINLILFQAINDGDTVLVDAGCDYEGYASDISRVFPVSGYFSAPQRAIYDALSDVHSRLLDYVKGTESLKLNELYLTMIECLADNLFEIGLFPSNIGKEELIYVGFYLSPRSSFLFNTG